MRWPAISTARQLASPAASCHRSFYTEIHGFYVPRTALHHPWIAGCICTPPIWSDPPTDNYFLKIFGQPQREMACQCERSTESNLSQALQMINGPVVHNKLRDETGRIPQMIKAKKSDDEIIASLYLTALSRPPAAEEVAASKAHIARSADHRAALEDIGWAILNCKEFLFQH